MLRRRLLVLPSFITSGEHDDHGARLKIPLEDRVEIELPAHGDYMEIHRILRTDGGDGVVTCALIVQRSDDDLSFR